MLINELELAIDLGARLDAVGARWLIGGSVASSLLGVPRATLDVDLVADLRMEHVEPLHAALIADYYADIDTMRWAVSTRRSFNAIHNATFIKVDVFCVKDDELSRAQLDRIVRMDLGGRSVPVCSAEDIILQKLLWYVESGGSERQWGDVLGVVKIRGAELDRAYLAHHAGARGISELLARLLAEA